MLAKSQSILRIKPYDPSSHGDRTMTQAHSMVDLTIRHGKPTRQFGLSTCNL